MHLTHVLTSSQIDRKAMSELVADFGGETRSLPTQGIGDWIIPWQREVRFLWWNVEQHAGFIYIDLAENDIEALGYTTSINVDQSNETVASPCYESSEVEKMRQHLGFSKLHIVCISRGLGSQAKVDEFAAAIIAQYGGVVATDAWWEQFKLSR